MKILLVNYHYFIRGGPDRYFFNIKTALEKAGHTVIPFAFDYDETIPNAYQKYFPEPITGRGPCMLDDQNLTFFRKVRGSIKMFHNPEVNRKFRLILRQERPDIIYSIYLSFSFLPNIFRIAKEEFSIPVVYRLSDFHMFCPSYIFHRNGHICTDCEQNLWAAVKYKCVHGWRLASFLRVLQMKYIRVSKWYGFVNAFVCPSKLMQEYLQKSGIRPEIVFHLPTFSQDIGAGDSHSDNHYILYFGRVSEEKGVEILLRAYNMLAGPKCRLKLVGPVNPHYRDYLLSIVDDSHRQLVSIDDPEQGEQLRKTVRQCRFVVQPSLCYENMPNSILEALSARKPVIASNIGSMPELIANGENGILVSPNDVKGLSESMDRLMEEETLEEMGRRSRYLYETKYTEQVHLPRLLDIFYGTKRTGS